jgi:hypothetical protein
VATFCGQPQDSGHITHVALQGTLCRGHILWTAAGQWTHHSCGAAGNTVSWPHSVDSRRTVDPAIMWRCKEHCVVATFCGQPQDSGHINHVALQGGGWLRPALCSSNHKHQKGGGGQRCFWVRPTLSKRKAHGGGELLVDLRNYGVGLSGDLRSSFEFSF